ncbi:DinB family protein [Radicibacter daui]|uniref:DinB family protein n=1 Tax=Radicibacter daui TaxID=3064829 RepID=UPI004046F3E4
MPGMLTRFFEYQAWANRAFLEALETVPAGQRGAGLDEALGLMNHIYAVADIFAHHLTGQPHGYQSDVPAPLLPLPDLRAACETLDRWYIGYVADIGAAELAAPLAFSFTDGDPGCMSREDMLGHVLLHGGYHRGEIGRLLKSLQPARLPWDTFAVFLHQNEPGRRQAPAA